MQSSLTMKTHGLGLEQNFTADCEVETKLFHPGTEAM